MDSFKSYHENSSERLFRGISFLTHYPKQELQTHWHRGPAGESLKSPGWRIWWNGGLTDHIKKTTAIQLHLITTMQKYECTFFKRIWKPGFLCKIFCFLMLTTNSLFKIWWGTKYICHSQLVRIVRLPSRLRIFRLH